MLEQAIDYREIFNCSCALGENNCNDCLALNNCPSVYAENVRDMGATYTDIIGIVISQLDDEEYDYLDAIVESNSFPCTEIHDFAATDEEWADVPF